MYGDITWTAYIGDDVPRKHMEVFQCVTGARDAAVELCLLYTSAAADDSYV